LAARLLRAAGAGRRALRVILINRSGRMARGVAYGTRSDLHVLNVPAGRMSALPEEEDHFVNFARSVDPSITGATFVPRSLYGDYLQRLLDDAVAAAAPAGASLELVVGDAVDLDVADARVTITLATAGRTIVADAAVLASGNYPPADPAMGNPALLQSPRYVRDPWASGAMAAVRSNESVLLIGTGLTMFDVALELSRRNGVRSMHAVSRRGLLPQPHRFPAAPAAHDHVPPDLMTVPATARHYVRSIRRYVRAIGARGVDWRDVLASIRPITPQMWQRLPPAERRRFLARVRPYWDVHRHRAAPEIYSAVRALIDAGELTVAAARVGSTKEHHGRLEVALRPRGGRDGEERVLRIDRAINCTGPDNDVRSIRDPLLLALRRRGLVRPDEIGIGLDVTDECRLIDHSGRANDRLFLLGPLLRGKYWEATAVPELREHAAKVCQELLRAE
jgi:uncharacterized NAD(P)/FAD-binding protein YdhS